VFSVGSNFNFTMKFYKKKCTIVINFGTILCKISNIIFSLEDFAVFNFIGIRKILMFLEIFYFNDLCCDFRDTILIKICLRVRSRSKRVNQNPSLDHPDGLLQIKNNKQTIFRSNNLFPVCLIIIVACPSERAIKAEQVGLVCGA